MRTPTILKTLAAAAMLWGAAAGCGVSNLDLCHAECDAAQRCLGASSTTTINCNNDCDAKKGTYSDQDTAEDKQCKNAGARRSQALNCAHAECDKIAACAVAIDGCVTN